VPTPPAETALEATRPDGLMMPRRRAAADLLRSSRACGDPVLKDKPRHPLELPRVVCDQCGLQGQGLRGDQLACISGCSLVIWKPGSNSSRASWMISQGASMGTSRTPLPKRVSPREYVCDWSVISAPSVMGGKPRRDRPHNVSGVRPGDATAAPPNGPTNAPSAGSSGAVPDSRPSKTRGPPVPWREAPGSSWDPGGPRPDPEAASLDGPVPPQALFPVQRADKIDTLRKDRHSLRSWHSLQSSSTASPSSSVSIENSFSRARFDNRPPS